jgi:glucosyl-3-phosphoglycerate phosphatase
VRWPVASVSDNHIKLVLLRHGQTRWNQEGRFQGQVDVSLDEVGVAQAEQAAQLLAALKPDRLISSDLERAMATTLPLTRLTGLAATADKDLRERYGGAWEGLTHLQIREQYPDEYARWEPPGGETVGAVAERVAAGLERVADELRPGGLAIAVSHVAALRLGMARLLGLPEELWGTIGPLRNCAWSVMSRYGRRWRLMEHNAGPLREETSQQ